MKAVPDWSIQAAWWASGIFATGAVWYFLSTNERGFAVAAAFAAVFFALIAVTLHRKNDEVDSKREDAADRVYLGSAAPQSQGNTHRSRQSVTRATRKLGACLWQPAGSRSSIQMATDSVQTSRPGMAPSSGIQA